MKKDSQIAVDRLEIPNPKAKSSAKKSKKDKKDKKARKGKKTEDDGEGSGEESAGSI